MIKKLKIAIKSRAEQYWGPVAEGAVGTSAMPLRARTATARGCMHAGTEKLGVLEASYASAIIGVERRLALDKPVARSRQCITATRAADSQSLRKASRPPQTRSLHLQGCCR